MDTTTKLVISSQNPQKLDFLLELLRNLPEVAVELVPAAPAPAAPAPASEAEADFWALAGIWKDRQVDLEQTRREDFERRTSSGAALPAA